MKYFKFEQFAISNTAKRLGIDNSVPLKFQPRAAELVDTILDPLREAWGSDIDMTSGYRCEELNNAIGGSKTSAHSHVYAADLVPSNGKVEEFKEFTMHWLYDNNIKFDQYINEYKGNSSWVHIGIRNGSGQQRQQYKLFYGGKYTKIDPNTFTSIKNRNMSGQPNNINKVDSDTQVTSIVQQEVNPTVAATTYDNNFTTGGGNTQTGSTAGLLTAFDDIYLKNISNKDNNTNDSVDNEQIKSNSIYQKDDNGDPILNEYGNPTVTDDYLYEFDEDDDMIDDMEVPNADEVYPVLSQSIQQNNLSNNSTQNSSVSNINNVPSAVDIEDKNANTPEAKKLLEDIRRKRNLEKWNLKSQDLPLAEAKAELYKWLQGQSIILQNAFYILIFKDMIDRIKTLIEQLQNTSQMNMVTLLNSLNDVISIFNDLGITPDAEGIDMQDLKNLGMAVVGTLADTGVNIGNQVYNNSMQYTQNNINASIAELRNQTGLIIDSDIIGKSQNIVAGATEMGNELGMSVAEASKTINSSDNKIGSIQVPTIAKATGSDIVANMVDGGINNIINTGQIVSMQNVTGAADELKNRFTNISNNIKEPFSYQQSNDGKNITIDIIINKDPALNIIKINSFLKSYTYGNNERIFNAGAIKYIRDTFNQAWQTNEYTTIYVDAIVEGITKHYIFNFTIKRSN